jgi:large subunit ribosomal protein L21
VKNGHRQSLSEIVIESIVASGAKKASPAKAEKAAPKKETKKAEPKVEAKAAAPKTEAKKVAPKKAAGKADDLKKVEGIGPKIASTLVEAGIATFADLAKTDSAKISEIIADVRGNHVTDTWPAQAQLAADGKWDELKKWQDELDGGKA